MAAARLPPEDRPELQGLSMNFPLLVAGSLALLGAGIHGVAGESLVVRRLSPGGLPSSPFGGPGMTKTMIRAAWHMTTVAFLAVGSALALSGAGVHGGTPPEAAVTSPLPENQPSQCVRTPRSQSARPRAVSMDAWP